MASRSLEHWNQNAAVALDQIEAAHRAVGGTRRGRRYATQQINQSYLVLVSSYFQQFCRSLHSEAAAHLTGGIELALRPIVQGALTVGRKLDHGNPNPGNLGDDFGRLGMTFWRDVNDMRRGNADRQRRLTLMGHWRNAIAHQDFASPTHVRELGGRSEISLREVRAYRSNCGRLARDFDDVVLAHIKAIAGAHAGW